MGSAPSALRSAFHPERAPARPRAIPLTVGLVGIVALVVVPVIVVLLLGYLTARQNTMEMFRREAANGLIEVSQRIQNHLDPVAVQSRYLAEMIASGEIEPSRSREFASVMTGALAGLSQIGELAFIDPSGEVLRVKRRTRETKRSNWRDDPRTRAVIADARTRKTGYWAESFFAESTRATLLNYRTPVWRDGRFQGILVAVVSTASLSDFIVRTSARHLRNTFILHGPDHVLAHPPTGTPRPDPSDDEPLPRLDQIGDPVLTRLAAEADWRLALDNASAAPESRIVSVGPETYIVSYRRLDGYGKVPLIVGFSLPHSNIHSQIDRIRMIAVVGVAILIVSVFAAYLLGRGLTRPVRQLATVAASVYDLDNEPARPVARSPFRELNDAADAVNALLSGLYWFKTYLPRGLVTRLIRGNVESIVSEEREVTVMFTDIYNFTGLSVNHSSHDLVHFLNQHFTLLAASVEAEAGTIDKYIGDSMMAFWGAPEDQPDHAERAFRAALEIASRIRRHNARRADDGLDPIRLRIGLHTGPAVVGNIGAPGRVNYTIVGDTVNVAQRIESLSKELHEDTRDAVILISAATIEALGGGLQDFSVGTHVLRGRYGPIEIFRLA
ncbi:MAG: adenylate/guanylate cyclase domain-containing protein [Planctomycetota bacterium]|nr:adenylate/guanylate cyclase domain-containing protein [Planctomycetota bacterium]